MSVKDVDPRLVAALTQQLAGRHGDRVGWKLGVGGAERIGKTLAVGHLTTSTLLEDGETYDAGGAAIHADAEVAVVVGVGYAPALELVDLSNAGDGADAVVATNILHRGRGIRRHSDPLARRARRPARRERRGAHTRTGAAPRRPTSRGGRRPRRGRRGPA